MNRVIKILMERDGMTEQEAINTFNNVKRMISDCEFDPCETEEIVREELGLEMDYIMDILAV